MMEYGNTSAASIPILLSEVLRIIESRWMEVKRSLLTGIRWRFDMGHTYCYNLVKHVETHFKIYLLF